MQKHLLVAAFVCTMAACAPSFPPTTGPVAAPTNVRVPDDKEYSVFASILFDGIRPVYAPVFQSADEANMFDEELIIGIAWEGEARAYPITVLRFREMVNDEMAGIPTLVTW